MPTFTAIALDRLIEPGASKSADKSVPKSRPPPKPKPVPSSNLERRHSVSSLDKRIQRPQIKPELYATPEATPLPDSPTSFPPSPYIINHKRRGPRLLKSFSEVDVASRRKDLDKNLSEDMKAAKNEVVSPSKGASITFTISDPIEKELMNGNKDCAAGSTNGIHGSSDVECAGINKKPANCNIQCIGDQPSNDLTVDNDSVKLITKEKLSYGFSDECDSVELSNPVKLSNGLAMENDSVKLSTPSPRREGESEDFFDPQESLSYASNTDGEDNGGTERSLRYTTPMGEFYDAWEELSSDGGTQSTFRDVEAELREMRLSLLMEIEKRKQAEEALKNMQSHWEKIRQQLSTVGIKLPAHPTFSSESEVINVDPVEDLCQQVNLARFVSESIGRGIAKAEAETEMEAQIELKNFEIARLMDRLNYYEAVNQEMSHRNQEAIEIARRNRQKGKRKQKWVWGSIAAAITLGSAAILWSYLPSGKGSALPSDHEAPEHHDPSK